MVCLINCALEHAAQGRQTGGGKHANSAHNCRLEPNCGWYSMPKGTAGALACWVVGLAPAQEAVGTAHAGQAEAR